MPRQTQQGRPFGRLAKLQTHVCGGTRPRNIPLMQAFVGLNQPQGETIRVLWCQCL